MDTTQDRLLATAADLFAEKGFAAVSMRAIARALDITQAAIYHHFDNKEELYFDSVRYLMRAKVLPILDTCRQESEPEQVLRKFVSGMLTMLQNSPQFLKMVNREMLDGDEARLVALSEDVFNDIHATLEANIAAINPVVDTHLSVISMAGMIFHHAESIKLGKVYPWYKPQYADTGVVADHISNLLLTGLKGQ